MKPYYQWISQEEKHTFQHGPGVGVHNIFLQNWINFGLLGLLGFLIWVGTLVVQILGVLRQGSITLKRNAQLLGFMAGLIGNLVASVFENNFRGGEVQTAIILVMGLSLLLLNKREVTTLPV
jgi:O-antigen ligase